MSAGPRRVSGGPRQPLPQPVAPLVATCAPGVEPLLAAECRRLLPGVEVGELRGAVQVFGGVEAMLTLNLESRLAQRVMWPLAWGRADSERAVYELARGVDWPAWISPAQSLRVEVTALRSPLQSLNFAALVVKDAVVDTLREATGARPSVDTRWPHLPLHLHLDGPDGVLHVDTSGEPLFKRGWRDERAEGGARPVKGEAPLKETLAAAMLEAAGWQGRAQDGPLLDPCCGAGTIAIEAAQIACGMAPGLRRGFAFEKLAPFAAALPAWRAQRAQAQARIHAPAVGVHASDVSFRMTDIARRNAERAGVAHALEIRTVDALQRPPPADAPGVLMLNPPYGERIEAKGRGSERHGRERPRFGPDGSDADEPLAAADDAALDRFLAELAAHWKRVYAGWTAWVLSPADLPGKFRLKAGRRVPLWNGPIECRLYRFDLVAGSARARSTSEPGPTPDA